MLKFAVFTPQGPAQTWPIRQAHLVGTDDVPTSGEIRFSNGLILCEKASDETVGLALEFPVDPPEDDGPGARCGGLLVLQSCLLPDRDRPYLLTLELARHRIMLILNKLEDWGLFELPPDDPILILFEQARERFTQAVVAQREEHQPNGLSPSADHLARQSLSLALAASERLAALNADRQMEGRLSGKWYEQALAQVRRASISDDPPTAGPLNPPGMIGVVLDRPPQIGCVVSEAQFSEELCAAVASACDMVAMPMRWVDMEPTEGRYSFAKTDRWIEWAVRTAKIPITGGPLIDFRPTAVPEWLYIWEHDYETLRELIYEHVKTLVTRYRRTVSRWTVVSGLHMNDNFKFSFEQVMDLTRMCVLLVRKLQPSAAIQVEISDPWGEYYAENRRSIPPMLYAEMCAQAGIIVESFGLRIQMGRPRTGGGVRDMMSLSALLDRYAMLDRPLVVSAIGAPSEVAEDGQDSESNRPGYWRAPWSAQSQEQWLAHAMHIALAKPFVHSVIWQDLYDAPRPREMPFGALIAKDGSIKPAARRLGQLHQAIRQGKVCSLLDGSAA